MTEKMDYLTLTLHEYGQGIGVSLPANLKLREHHIDALNRFVTSSWSAMVAEQLMFSEQRYLYATVDVKKRWWQFWKPKQYRGRVRIDAQVWKSYPYLSLPERLGPVHFYRVLKESPDND